jgi:hypothetical protein
LSLTSKCDVLTSVRNICFALILALPLAAEVKVQKGDNRVDVEIGGKPFTTFYFGPDTTKPYLHPLRAASGKVITRLYPMEKVEGESRDHPHHRGLWFTHGDVNGWDFWGNEVGEKSPMKGLGTVVLDKINKLSSGKDHGTIEATFKWLDPSKKQLISETRTMTFYDDPNLRTIDFDIDLKALEKVTFGDTKEGTFAIRLADALSEKKGGLMTNAEGAKGMKNVWGKRSPWVDYSGEIGGEKVGVAILDNPKNPRHPTWWHSRDYGLFAANIFGLHDFENDKSKDGSFVIEAGKTARFRYRVIIHPGDTASADIGKAFEVYSKK